MVAELKKQTRNSYIVILMIIGLLLFIGVILTLLHKLPQIETTTDVAI